MSIRSAQFTDAASIADLYNHFVLTSMATFELEPPARSEMAQRISDILVLRYPYLVAEENGEVIGFAYAHQYRARPAYGKTVEVSVYIKPGYERRGVASALYRQLLPSIFQAGFHTVLAGIALPNDASVRLHEKFGFRKVAHFSEVGRKFDRWIDVGYWQLTVDIDGPLTTSDR